MSTTSANQTGYTSSNIRSEYYNSATNAIKFAITTMLREMNTFLPCEVLVNEGNQRYTIRSLVNYLDILAQPITPPSISNIPRIQNRGGEAGIITELEVGDIVLVGFCQRNISTVKENWTQQNPSNLRYCDLADGIILGKLSNDLPTTYVKITANGIEIVSPNGPVSINSVGQAVTVDCDSATVTANTVVVDSGDIILGNDTGAASYVLNENTTITAPNGPCTISNPSITTKCN